MLDSKEKRSYFETFCTILKTCDTGNNTTQIPHQVDLDDKQLTRYVTTLVGYGLLETVGDGYRATAQGRLFVKRFEGLLETLKKE